MSRQDKLNEGQVLLDDLNNYRPLDKPMVETTTKKAQQLIKTLLSEGHIDKTAAKWLSLIRLIPRKSQCFTHLLKSTNRHLSEDLIVSLRNRTAGRRGRQEEEDGRTLECDKRNKAISYVFCRDLHLTSMFSGLLQKDLFKGKWSLAKSYCKQNYCHACHTRFAVFFPLHSCCVSSLISQGVPDLQSGCQHLLTTLFSQ